MIFPSLRDYSWPVLVDSIIPHHTTKLHTTTTDTTMGMLCALIEGRKVCIARTLWSLLIYSSKKNECIDITDSKTSSNCECDGTYSQ